MSFNKKQHCVALIVNSTVEDGLGIVCEIIILNGSLKAKDSFWTMDEVGSIKKMLTQEDSICVKFTGLKKAPQIGTYLLGIQEEIAYLLPNNTNKKKL